MTANAFEEDRKKALAKGMNGHIAKPVDAEKLKKTILSALRWDGICWRAYKSVRLAGSISKDNEYGIWSWCIGFIGIVCFRMTIQAVPDLWK